MKKLYFIRHGLSEMNIQGLFAGRTETPLTAEGRQQAKAAGVQAKDLNFDFIAASPLQRAVETAQIIAKEIDYPIKKISINMLLIERDFGELEGKPWSPDLDLDGISDIETVDSLLVRTKLALDWIETIDADNILIVSHGAFGRALRSLLQPDYPFINVSASNRGVIQLHNATIYQWM